MGRRGFDRMRSPRAATTIALASATGQARTLPASRTSAGGMVPCSIDAVPDAAGLALKRPGQLGDLHHGPAIGGDRRLGVLELPVVIEESVPEHLVERVELKRGAIGTPGLQAGEGSGRAVVGQVDDLGAADADRVGLSPVV
jgi:hypothetical protein